MSHSHSKYHRDVHTKKTLVNCNQRVPCLCHGRNKVGGLWVPSSHARRGPQSWLAMRILEDKGILSWPAHLLLDRHLGSHRHSSGRHRHTQMSETALQTQALWWGKDSGKHRGLCPQGHIYTKCTREAVFQKYSYRLHHYLLLGFRDLQYQSFCLDSQSPDIQG